MATFPIGQDRLVGQTLGHYRIAEKIGAGGMGEVFRAHDQHLDRDVAIKVLPPGTLGDESARKRFQKEALALSKLNHPNIATIYDFDTQQGVGFLVMEYIPGIALSEKLAGRPLPEKEVISLGTQLAEGLSAAHEHGVIHRDLKPGNLRLTAEGRLKILDFGLARLLAPTIAEAETESMTQAVVGTVPYMSPEQLRGETVDARSDVWSAGAVLYEMATGKMPFREKVTTATAEAILHKIPAAPRMQRKEVSVRLEEVILKCLEKEADNRYQSAKELAVDLRRLSSPPPSGEVSRPRRNWKRWAIVTSIVAAITSLALALFFWLKIRSAPESGERQAIQSLVVLPLTNLSGDPGQEYLADGMTEALITELSQISSLKVISRTSAMHYKNSNKPLPQIAKELNVGGIIEGSVLRSGDRVRVTVQLINASSDTHLWAESYERDVEEVIPLEQHLALAIAHEVSGRLTTAEENALTSKQTASPKAYDAYLRGRYLWNERTPQRAAEAAVYFEQALREDPNFAPAYSGLADHYGVGWGDWVNLTVAESYARKAVMLGPDLAEAHASLGIVSQYQGRFAEAEKELKRAIDLNPNYAMAHHWYAMHLHCMGRVNEALAENDQARRLDPFSVPINNFRTEILISMREYDRAIEQAERMAAISASTAKNVSDLLARIYWLQGRGGQAIAEERKLANIVNVPPSTKRDLDQVAKVYASLGFHTALLRAAQIHAAACGNISEQPQWSDFCDAGTIASKYALLGDKEKAMYWLQQGVRSDNTAKSAMLVIGIKSAPEYEMLRSDPRFVALLRQLGLPN